LNPNASHVSPSLDAGESVRENPLTGVVDLDVSGASESGALEAEVESADASEKGKEPWTLVIGAHAILPSGSRTSSKPRASRRPASSMAWCRSGDGVVSMLFRPSWRIGMQPHTSALMGSLTA
jgi:hypothetical protein